MTLTEPQLRGLSKLKDWDYLWVQHISWSLVLPPSWNHGTSTSPSGAPATSWFCIGFLCGSVLNRCQECLRAAPSLDIILRDNDIPQLYKSRDHNITDLVSGIPLKLPPIWEVNHEINLIDPKKRIHYQLLKCPEHFHEEVSQKIERYTTAQWWIPAVAHQAVPMLCILKKNSKPHCFQSMRTEQ